MTEKTERFPTLVELAACGVPVLRREEVDVRVPCHTSKGVVMERDAEIRDYFAPGVRLSGPDVCFFYCMTHGSAESSYGVPNLLQEEWIQARIRRHELAKAKAHPL